MGPKPGTDTHQPTQQSTQQSTKVYACDATFAPLHRSRCL